MLVLYLISDLKTMIFIESRASNSQICVDGFQMSATNE